MSIKGIDTQIMVARTTDFVRDTSAMQKKPELTQEFLAVQAKVNEAQDQSRVNKTTESEMQKLNVDDGGGSGGGGGGGGDRNGQDDEQQQEALVPPENHIIDIRV